MEERKIRVAITHGDTNGIGYELIFKAFENPAMLELYTPVIYGSPKVATYHRKALSMQVNFTIVNNAEDARNGRINLLTTFDEEIKVELGKPSEDSGKAGLKAIDRALADWQAGLVDVLVTAPLDGSEAFPFIGQARYIEDHIESNGKGLAILADERLRIALATCQIPLEQVAGNLTKENITEKVKTLHTSLRRDFRISNPRIAVLAMNPKTGGNGLTGTKEKETIAPMVEALANDGIQTFGPYPAGGFFGNRHYDKFDGVLAMYYEQGLIPFSIIDNGEGVCYTAGLPIVLTAPVQGPSFDMAGKNTADASSLRNAVFLAADIFRHRAEYDGPFTNPLKKLYKEKRDESDKVRFSVPKKHVDNGVQDNSTGTPSEKTE